MTDDTGGTLDLALADLAAGINADHDAAEQAVGTALERARSAGGKLLLAKARVAHGQWLPWLASNCPRLAARTAQGYMRLAREWDTLASKYAEPAHLTVDGALKLLAAPADVPEWARGLSAAETATLEQAGRDIGTTYRALCQCLDDVGGLLRAMRDRKGWKALGFVSFEAFAEFGHALDPEMSAYLLDPPQPWLHATDAMHTAQVRWLLRQQGLSDAAARAQMAQWDAEQAAA